MTLDETYERILLGIDREKREHTIRLLRCLAIARRPLRAQELAEVLATHFDGPIPTLDISLRPGDADEAVLSACSALVAIVKPDVESMSHYDDVRVVQFSHYSIKEFLTSERLAKSEKGDISQYHVSLEPAHTVLAQSCLGTLLQPNLHVGGTTGHFPLAKYAAENWFHHGQYDGVAPKIQSGIESLFDLDRTHFESWLSIHDIDDSWYWRYSTGTRASPLYYAALCGIGSLVEHLLITCRQGQSHGKQGSPLRAAIISGHTEVTRLLIRHAAGAVRFNVNVRERYNMTLLHDAVNSGNLDIAKILISYGADINARDGQGRSVLQEALRNRKFDITELLIECGAECGVGVWALHHDHSAPLHEAIDSGNLEIAQLLIGHGADVNAPDKWGDRPFHRAVRSRSLDLVELLLKSGADIGARGMSGSSPLHEALENGNLDIARLLIGYGANVNAHDKWGDSPFHVAVRSQRLDFVELLLESGADVDVRGMNDSTPLHEALDNGNLDIAQLLINHGADVNVPDKWGHSPLCHALQRQKPDVVELLASGGADVDARGWCFARHDS